MQESTRKIQLSKEMKATTKEEVEKAWALYIDRKAGYVNPMQAARETLSDFKSALRARIENLIIEENSWPKKKNYHNFLNLLETTLPPKE